MKKRMFVSVLATGAALLLLTGCGDSTNNSTSMDAAQSFITALSKGDSQTVQKLDHSDPMSYPSQLMIEDANNLGMVGKSLSDYKFKQINDREVEVDMNFGNHNVWKLEFVKESDGYYFDRLVH